MDDDMMEIGESGVIPKGDKFQVWNPLLKTFEEVEVEYPDEEEDQEG